MDDYNHRHRHVGRVFLCILQLPLLPCKVLSLLFSFLLFFELISMTLFALSAPQFLPFCYSWGAISSFGFAHFRWCIFSFLSLISFFVEEMELLLERVILNEMTRRAELTDKAEQTLRRGPESEGTCRRPRSIDQGPASPSPSSSSPSWEALPSLFHSIFGVSKRYFFS